MVSFGSIIQPKRSVSYQSSPCPPITPAMALATAIITFKRIFQLFFFICLSD
ncbi:hypothetical protein BFAG_00163 [Bacteroides fragilis 3_1_12]|uniref:Uncharacterized protein n=1 Tax=Bacteroides fragilis 3_1_12 TaxID=457424 RepID=A0ABN0BF53_BACFG|nr:hypothetical protein BFAG_00163 [Bacteroides fragilis 3_1_12]